MHLGAHVLRRPCEWARPWEDVQVSIYIIVAAVLALERPFQLELHPQLHNSASATVSHVFVIQCITRPWPCQLQLARQHALASMQPDLQEHICEGSCHVHVQPVSVQLQLSVHASNGRASSPMSLQTQGMQLHAD